MAAFSQFASDLDAATQRLLNRGARLTELLKQGQYQPMPVELQVCVIYAGVHGYLDRTPLNRVSAYEQGLVSEVEANGQDVLQSVREEGALSPETEGKLKELLDKYTQAFA
jgi:F-type H+/Na+-transporting ATPase subunit alpha